MLTKKKRAALILINTAMIILACTIQYNGFFTLKIGNANPMLPLCVLISLSMFNSELESVIAGLFTGMITDSAAATPIGFNTILMMTIALSVSLTVHYFFNNNVRAAAALAVMASLVYFTLRWLLVIFKINIVQNLEYLLRFALPSVVYTTVIVIPLYYFQRCIHKHYS